MSSSDGNGYMGGIIVKKTETARRGAILNVVLVIAAVLILAAGVLTLGSLAGWFDKPEEASAAVVTATPELVLPEAETAEPNGRCDT